MTDRSMFTRQELARALHAADYGRAKPLFCWEKPLGTGRSPGCRSNAVRHRQQANAIMLILELAKEAKE